MDALLYLIPALACGLMMLACMVLMGRLMWGHGNQTTQAHEVAAVRDEVARLRAEGDAWARTDG